MTARGLSWTVLLAAVGLIAAPGAAVGQSLFSAFSLDLFVNPNGSGGSWQIVGKTTSAGFAGMDLSLGNTETATIVLPAELGSGAVSSVGFGHYISININTTPPVPYGVGVIGGPIPSSYVDPPGLQTSPAWDNAGSFTGGVVLAEGTYLSGGPSPSWSTGAGGASSRMFLNTTSTDMGTARALKQLRYVVVPEPASASLAGMAVVGILAASQRRLARSRSER
jgi:hypothetical protein